MTKWRYGCRHDYLSVIGVCTGFVLFAIDFLVMFSFLPEARKNMRKTATYYRGTNPEQTKNEG